jgi:hypothetical protein
MYYHGMSHRQLLESVPPPPPSNVDEVDVEPYFPEPLIELDVDNLD